MEEEQAERNRTKAVRTSEFAAVWSAQFDGTTTTVSFVCLILIFVM
jgi:hypothetical protein